MWFRRNEKYSATISGDISCMLATLIARSKVQFFSISISLAIQYVKSFTVVVSAAFSCFMFGWQSPRVTV